MKGGCFEKYHQLSYETTPPLSSEQPFLLRGKYDVLDLVHIPHPTSHILLSIVSSLRSVAFGLQFDLQFETMQEKKTRNIMAIISRKHYQNKQQLLQAHKNCIEKLKRIMEKDDPLLIKNLAKHERRMAVIEKELQEYQDK